MDEPVRSYMFGDFSEDDELGGDRPPSGHLPEASPLVERPGARGESGVAATYDPGPGAVLTDAPCRYVGSPTDPPCEHTPPQACVEDLRDLPPRGWKRVGRGVYLQTLLQLKQWTDDQLVAAVHAYYPNSRTGVADVKFNASMIARRVGVQPMTLRLRTEQRELLPPPPWDALMAEFHGNVLLTPTVHTILAYLDRGEVASVTPFDGAPVPQVMAPTPSPAPQTPAIPQLAVSDDKQPSRFRESVDPDRVFDKTSLREKSHGQWIHRDYFAHAMRWAHAGRYINGATDVLDVGCGPDVQLINVLTMPRNQVPKSYVGVDFNREPQKHPNRQWATLHWQFNFIERWQELGQSDVVTCFEMLEHVHLLDGPRVLEGLKGCLRNDGLLLLSTPVFNGKAAATHLHEWTIPELAGAIETAGLVVERRFGTFARATDLRKVATEEDLRMVARLHPYYSDEVLACFLAPLYPDASRNNVWLCRRA